MSHPSLCPSSLMLIFPMISKNRARKIATSHCSWYFFSFIMLYIRIIYSAQVLPNVLITFTFYIVKVLPVFPQNMKSVRDSYRKRKSRKLALLSFPGVEIFIFFPVHLIFFRKNKKRERDRLLVYGSLWIATIIEIAFL